jgi:hypothetical protein
MEPKWWRLIREYVIADDKRDEIADAVSHALKAARQGARREERKRFDPNDPAIVEPLAEAVHNAWWQEKINQGVTHHPDAIPYAELSERVKEYDRVTVRVVLNAIRAMPEEEHNEHT